MDRFYLGKLIEDINGGVAGAMDGALAGHLVYFAAMDRVVEAEDSHMKVLRYLYAVSPECPAGHLLDLKGVMEKECQRFSGSDYGCQCHFGGDDWAPVEESGYTFALQFFHLDPGMDHGLNKWLAAGVVETPEHERLLPRWLHYDQGLEAGRLQNEILCFCQLYVSKHVDQLFQVRGVEAAFWRLINQACAFYEKETYEELVDMFPLRFREPLMDLPNQWSNLRKREHGFSDEDFARCGRLSLRFCQQSMELFK